MERSRITSAIDTLSATAWIAPAAVISSIMAKITLRFRTMIWIGWISLTLGLGLNALMLPDSDGGVIYGLRIFSSIGAGILFTSPIFAVQINQEGGDVGIATTLSIFFRSLGQAFGVGIGGVIFQNEWTKEVGDRVASGVIPKAYIIDSNAAEQAYTFLPTFPEPVQTEYRWVYADSLRLVWFVTTGLSAAAMVVSFVMRNESLDKGANGKQGFKHGNEKEVDVEKVVG